MDNIETILSHYGSQEKWAQAWGVTPSAVSQWVSDGRVPVKRLVDLEWLTDGALHSVIVDGRVVVVKGKAAQ